MTSPASRPQALTVHVPMKFTIRGGRKMVITELVSRPRHPRTENALLKALARAYRRRQQIEGGEYASITELAKANRVNESYACRLLRLTLLAPSIVTDILNGRETFSLTLKELTRPFPVR